MKAFLCELIRSGVAGLDRLAGANLSGADVSGAGLGRANLCGANLSEANLSGADLRGANLSEASLSGANLNGADLREANLNGADLRGTSLYETKVTQTNLSGAKLSETNLTGREVWAELQKILSSQTFRNSKRHSRFLTFVVTETLRGNTESIKESVIGLEVFDRKPDFDPAADPLVRVEAGRLRSRLAAYYGEPGQHDPIRIELPKGTYVPVFYRSEGHTAA